MRHVLYPLLRRGWWAWKDYPAHQIASLLDESQWWPREKLKNFRNEKLSCLINHCYEHVPYYRSVMTEYGLRPSDIRTAEDLSKLPILSKEIIRAKWRQLQADNIPDTNIFIAETGGSTGEPMRIAKANRNEAWANMCFERGISWGGLKPGMKHVALTGGSLGTSHKTWWQQFSRRLSGEIHLLAYDLEPGNLHEYVDVIRGSRAQFIIGYASVVYQLARMLSEGGINLSLTAAYTTSESLLPSWADTIRRVMNCKVYDYYGCGESNSLAFQCKEGSTYHIPEEHVLLEIEAETGEIGLLGQGQVLITDLDNYAMPLLRYRNGDYLTIGDEACSCGRCLRVISKLEGRTSGFLLNRTGQLISGGICDFIMTGMHVINEFQVRQNAVDHIHILVVPHGELREEHYSYIRKAFRYYLGDAVDVDIEVVNRIPRTRAQKLQTAISEIVRL
jgi:phenylacetate-CoA ligase